LTSGESMARLGIERFPSDTRHVSARVPKERVSSSHDTRVFWPRERFGWCHSLGFQEATCSVHRGFYHMFAPRETLRRVPSVPARQWAVGQEEDSWEAPLRRKDFQRPHKSLWLSVGTIIDAESAIPEQRW